MSSTTSKKDSFTSRYFLYLIFLTSMDERMDVRNGFMFAG